MSKILKNNSGSDIMISDIGQTILDTESHTIDHGEYARYARSSSVMTHIGSGDLVVNDGSDDLSISDGIDLIKGAMLRTIDVTASPPFASKHIGSKNIFSRATGKSYSVSVGSNVLEMSVAYAQVKFNGLEIINSVVGEKVSLYVMDDASGTYSTIPNYQLNQFGFDVNLPNGCYTRESNYDADLYSGMVVKVVYEAVEAKTVYINYLIHELKD